MEIQTIPLPIPSEGMNTETHPMQLKESEAVILQDVIFNEEGTLMCRGTNALAAGGSSPSGFPNVIGAFTKDTGLAGTQPVPIMTINGGTDLYAGGSGAISIGISCADARGLVTEASTPEGTLIGILTNPFTNSWSYHGLGFSKAVSPNFTAYSTGQIAISGASLTSTTVTGTGTSWSSNYIGYALYIQAQECSGSNYLFAGIIQSVGSTTSITLEDNSRCSVGASAKNYIIMSYRPFETKIGRGRITTTTSSTTVTGFNSIFTQELLGGLNWHLYRLRDHRWIGRITTVNNDTTVTLNANAGISMNTEAYYCVPERSVPTGNDIDLAQASGSAYGLVPGGIVCSHKGRYWYACRPGNALGVQLNRVWFSRTGIPELLDYADGGYFFDVALNSGYKPYITGMASIGGVLLVFTQSECYVIAGDSPADFVVQKISDIGCISGNTIRHYNDSVIFLSNKGIYRTNGSQFIRLTEKVNTFYNYLIRDCDIASTSTSNAWAWVGGDHYICYVNATRTGDITSTLTLDAAPAICINLLSGAITFFANFPLVASTDTPGIGYLILENAGASAYNVKRGTAEQLFAPYGNASTDVTGSTYSGGSAGTTPRVKWLSKIYTLGDPFVEKYLKGVDVSVLTEAADNILFKVAENTTLSYSSPSVSATITGSAGRTFYDKSYIAVEKRTPYFHFQFTSSPTDALGIASPRLHLRFRRGRRN